MLIIIFFPTILLLLTIPLWYCKKVSNEALEIIAYCCMFLPMLFLFLTLKGPTGESEYGGAVLLSLLMLLANSWQVIIYRKKLRNNRCPLCRKLSLKMMSRSKDEYSNTRTKIYRYEGQNGRFMQRSSIITTFTTYDLWCPQCKEAFSWTDKKVDHLDSGEKKIK